MVSITSILQKCDDLMGRYLVYNGDDWIAQISILNGGGNRGGMINGDVNTTTKEDLGSVLS